MHLNLSSGGQNTFCRDIKLYAITECAINTKKHKKPLTASILWSMLPQIILIALIF